MGSSETKRCPFCGEEILAVAIRCKHCHAMLDGSTPLPGGTPLPGARNTRGGDPRAAATGMAVGMTVNPYELKRFLGAGGMGEVYEAEHSYTGQRVALRVVWPNLMADENARPRFVKEGRVLAKLKHPCVAGLHDFFEEQGRFFLVMEYIEGEPLEKVLGKYRGEGKLMPVEEVVRVLEGVLSGLEYGHGQSPPVVHWNIKPSNVMVARDGRVVVMDFGIAKLVGGEELTRTRAIVGACDYMSPEQITGKAVTPASDVYAVGVLAHEMLTGRVPFEGKTDSGIGAMEGRRYQASVCLRADRPDCPGWLGELVEKALSNVPAERYADAGEMVAALRRVGTGLELRSPARTAAPAPVAAGGSHTCAVKDNGTVWCWGKNDGAQLGDGTTKKRKTPVEVRGLIGAIGVAAGGSHTCALKEDGTVWCWGWNNYGQLGDDSGGLFSGWKETPVQVKGLSGAAALAAGQNHTCALRKDGTVWCWGENLSGQLGDGTMKKRKTPVQVRGLIGAIGVAAGGSHTCALKEDGTVWCWGSNLSGQLGDATRQSRRTPVQATGLTGAIALAAGQHHSCALREDGTVWCWGKNKYGQLGDGTKEDKTTPVQVKGLTSAIALAAGHHHICALREDGTVWCWGKNKYGQLGDGTKEDKTTPVQVKGLTGVIALAAGEDHTCALREDGTVWCWGKNKYGQLGDGTEEDRTTPVQVAGYP